LLNVLGGDFTVLAIDTEVPQLADVDGITLKTVTLDTGRDDVSGAIAARYLGDAPSGIYLIRPDQHVAARWAVASAADIQSGVRIATGRGQ
jgi:3-(3-hydroxy-phenyl)propionate hydroxylase